MELGRLNLNNQNRLTIPDETALTPTIQSRHTKVTLSYICELFANIWKAGEEEHEALGSHFESLDEMQKVRELILDIAIQSLNIQESEETQSMTSVITDCGGIYFSVTSHDDNRIVLQLGDETCLITGYSIAQMQKKIRETVDINSHWYNGYVSMLLVNAVKQRIALDDLTSAFRDKIDPPSARVESFYQNCVHIYEALIPVLLTRQKKSPVTVTLSDNTQITITKRKRNIILGIANYQAILNDLTLETLFIQLNQLLNQKQLFASCSSATLETLSYIKLGWQGRRYNKSSPSAEELHPNYKKQPYRSIRPGISLCNLNTKASFPIKTICNPKKLLIACRHLATQYIQDCWKEESAKGKVNWILYSTKESILAHISPETETDYHDLVENASFYHLIENDDFGYYIQECFKSIQRSDNRKKFRTLLMESTDHVMAIKLCIKGTEEVPIYVINFYDPNITNGPVRCRTNDLESFKGHSLEQYINGAIGKVHFETNYGHYYSDEQDHISLVVVCNPDRSNSASIKAEKKLTSYVSELPTPTQLFFFLKYNFPHELAQMQDQIQKIGETSLEDLFVLLAAKGNDGTPGLSWALQEGHAEVIKTYGALLQFLPVDNRRIELIAAKDKDGAPGLVKAFSNGHAEAIQAYGELLQPLSKHDSFVSLLTAKMPDGTSGLVWALMYGQVAAIEAYGKCLKQFPELKVSELVELLSAKVGRKGKSGLLMAMIAGHKAAVTAYLKLLERLPEKERLKLMNCFS